MKAVDRASRRTRAGEQSLWGVTWPLLLSLTLTLSLNFVDTLFLSRFSDSAAAGAGSVLPILGTTYVMLVAMSQAGTAVAGQLLGAERWDEVSKTHLALLVLGGGLGLLTSLGLWTLHFVLPRLLGLEGETLGHAQVYLGMLGSAQWLRAVQLGFASILNSRGETRWVLAEALLTNVSNLALNFAFTTGLWGIPPLGVMGVALATVLSMALGLLLTVWVVRHRLGVRLPWGTPWRELESKLRPILRIGVPSALEPLAYQCSQMTINVLVISLGAQVLAARIYVFNLFLITTMLWSIAFGTGTQILIAQHVGAGRFDAADRALRRGLGLGMGGSLVLSGVLVFAHPWLLDWVTQDQAVRAHAAPLFLVAPLVEVGRAINIVAGGALRSSGDARFTSLVGMLMMWGIGVPACYLFASQLGLGLTGIWLGMAVDEVTRAYVNHRRWRRGHWRAFGVARLAPGARARFCSSGKG